MNLIDAISSMGETSTQNIANLTGITAEAQWGIAGLIVGAYALLTFLPLFS